MRFEFDRRRNGKHISVFVSPFCARFARLRSARRHPHVRDVAHLDVLLRGPHVGGSNAVCTARIALSASSRRVCG